MEAVFNACKNQEHQGANELVLKFRPAIETLKFANVSDNLPNEIREQIILYADDFKKASLISKKWYFAAKSKVVWGQIAKELGLSPPRSADIRNYVTGYIKRLNKLSRLLNVPDCLQNPTSLRKFKLLQDWKKARDRYAFWEIIQRHGNTEKLEQKLEPIREKLNPKSPKTFEEIEKNLIDCKELFCTLTKNYRNLWQNYTDDDFYCYNYITHLPPEFSLLDLEGLTLENNGFWEFPTEILKQKNLGGLFLYSRFSIKKIPENISGSNLAELEIHYSPRFSECMQTDLEKMFDIEALFLSGRDLEIPSSIAKSKINHLDLSGIRGRSHLPKAIGEIQTLEVLSIVYPFIPKEFKNLKKMETFTIDCKSMPWLKNYYSGSVDFTDDDTLLVDAEGTGELIELQTARDTLHVWEKLAIKIGITDYPQVAKHKTVNETLSKVKEFTVWMQKHKTELQKVQSLILSNFNLTSLPDEIGQLENLLNLNIGGNYLTDVPDCVFQLKNLKYLDLRNNKLEDLSNSVRELQKLKVLRLEGNYLKELPEELGNLTNLKQLDLHDNRLKILPNSLLSNLGRFEIVRADFNLRNLPKGISVSGVKRIHESTDQGTGQPPYKKSKHN